MTSRPWSNGKVGTTGCSSTAEWQIAAVARNVPGFAAFNAQGFGCGVGRIGPYYEQGNWYRGGVFMMYNLTWFYDNQKPQHPMFPRNMSQEDLIRLSRGLGPGDARCRVADWNKAYWHLPLQDILKSLNGPKGVFADAMPVATGGRMIQRTPNDPAWYKGALYHDDMRINVPGLWYTSLYDIALAPNLELYNLVRKTAKGEAANQQWLIIAPVGHCAFNGSTREDHRRRARYGRRPAQLPGDHVRLLRPDAEGRDQQGHREPAQGALLHDGQQQVEFVGHVAAEGRDAGDLLPDERRQGQHTEWRRHA